MKIFRHKKAQRERGQGLVEMVLVLPFLLVLVVGIVEGGVALNRQLTVVNSAREGARLGANGADTEDIYLQTLEATSDMFEFTEENAVVAVIHATTNGSGTGFNEWTETLYPAGADVPHVSQDEVLAQLREEGDGNAANLKLVVVDVRYDHESMLGMPFVGAMADQIPIGSWTAMRLPAPTSGWGSCCALPIALEKDAVNWPEGFKEGEQMPDIRIGTGSSQFGWLFWDPDNNGSAVNLEENIKHPCNALREFKDACDGDTALTPDSWVSGDSGESVASNVRDALMALKDSGYIVPIPVWDQFVPCNDMPGWCGCEHGSEVVHIVAFANVKITKVCLTSGTPGCDPPGAKYVSGTFHGWYDGCDPED
jgi:Flp pilus assembly protein TadG